MSLIIGMAPNPWYSNGSFTFIFFQRPLLPQRQDVNVLSEFDGVPIEPIVAPEPEVQAVQISLLKKVDDRPTLSTATEGLLINISLILSQEFHVSNNPVFFNLCRVTELLEH